MKRYVALFLVVLAASSLCACANATPQVTEGTINPGDTVGNFLITTSAGREVLYPFDYSSRCTDQGDNVTYSCKFTVGENINITTGLYDGTVSSAPATATPKLNEYWTDFDYRLSIEGRLVDLEAFGYVEVMHPILGVMRFWDVVITTDKAGDLSTQDSGMAGGEPYKSANTWIFSVP